jgi:hypothetical protein
MVHLAAPLFMRLYWLCGDEACEEVVIPGGDIFHSGMSRPASSDDAIVFPEALSEAAVVAEKAEPSVEVASLRARVDAMDMADAAPALLPRRRRSAV